jgi:guanine deaminase
VTAREEGFEPRPGFMRLAISEALEHLEEAHGGPFGACLVRDEQVLAVAHNTVLRDRDPTAHAEINAIRAGAARLGTRDLSGCVIYSTTEPCPMCFGAIHWARIDRLVYGTRIEDVGALGFRELWIDNVRMKAMGQSPVILHGDFLRQECLDLLQRWRELPGRQLY